MEKQPKKLYPRGIINDLMCREMKSDVLGSYTGVPEDPDDLIPVQDADDL